jgi:hypothetical protein
MKYLIIIITLISLIGCEGYEPLLVTDPTNLPQIHLNFRVPPDSETGHEIHSRYAELYYNYYEDYCDDLVELIHVPESCDTNYNVTVEVIYHNMVAKWWKQDTITGKTTYFRYEFEVHNDSTYTFGWNK